MINTNIPQPLDFLGNSIQVGDKVIAVIGKHLRKSVIETFVNNNHHVKIVGLKNLLYLNEVIKLEWN